MIDTDTIEQILLRLPKLTIGLIGDLFLDRYFDLDDRLTEPSIETGKSAYQVVKVRSYPGALGTVLNNLVALGVGRIVPISVVGDDGEGHELRQALTPHPQVETGAIQWTNERRTPTYTKPMLMRSGMPAEELNRIDIKNRRPMSEATERRVIADWERWFESVDAWIVLDQVSEENCGVVTDSVRRRIQERASGRPDRFVLADSRERISRFEQVCLKPNRRELGDDPDRGSAWARRTGRAVFVTDGERGIDVFLPSGERRFAPGYPVRGPIDPVGAGDSVSAAMASAVAAGESFDVAAAFGNLVASITVQQIGVTGTASPDQVRARRREIAEGGS